MKVFTVVGARPQFIKAAPVSKAIRARGHTEYLAHTGQHYDHGMSQVFFDELDIPQPDVNLNIGSGSHGKQTGKMLIRLEEEMLAQQPDIACVYGDTNSTLAAALAAVKLQIPVAHVEAGLRSFNREMPEEHNRVLTDHCADLLFCPTQTAVDLLAKEGISRGVHLVGDTMYDAVLQFSEIAQTKSNILNEHSLDSGGYLLATVHRSYNTDAPQRLENILNAFAEIDETLVFPIHPRTRQKIETFGLSDHLLRNPKVRLIDPIGYLDMLTLLKNARLLITDSGGMQKEAYFFAVPCITLRPETEWVETVESGWNILVGADKEKIMAAVKSDGWPCTQTKALFGDGKASQKIATILSTESSASGHLQ